MMKNRLQDENTAVRHVEECRVYRRAKRILVGRVKVNDNSRRQIHQEITYHMIMTWEQREENRKENFRAKLRISYHSHF